VAATWPAILQARSHFLSGGAPAHGEASPGDHLQTLYHYWLVGHQLEHGRAPWRDPYSFRPEAKAQPNFSGWPYGILFWPLGAVFGLMRGWNVIQLLFYALAGLAACAWLRELGLPRGPALAGGLAFAIAPYRVEQSVGHLLGPISILLPLSLWAFERARRGSPWWLALASASLASIPLSGQVHLPLGAIPFFVAYALCRTRNRPLLLGAGAGAVAAIGAGLVVRKTVIQQSTQSGGRTLDEISFYSAHVGDFVSRHVDHARSEQFVFLGWATPVVALAGLLLLIPLLGTADTDREKSVGSHMMCICGCQQVLTECNHIHCPSSVPMRAEVHEKLAAGLTDDQAYAAFVEKYGPKVLAAPPFKGLFNITAWLASLAVLLGGGAGLIYYLRRLKTTTVEPAADADAIARVAGYNQKIEDELDKFTPED